MLGKLILDLPLTTMLGHRVFLHNKLFLRRVFSHLSVRRLEGRILPGTPLKQHVLLLGGQLGILHVALARL